MSAGPAQLHPSFVLGLPNSIIEKQGNGTMAVPLLKEFGYMTCRERLLP